MDTKVAEFAQKLGARIVQLRKEHNFAQERLATLARMNKGYLSSVESGQRVPSVGMLAKLSKVLQVHVFDLFVFPDGSPLDRLWEEVRNGTSPAATTLRAQFGLAPVATAGQGKTVKLTQKARTTRALPTTTRTKTAKPAAKAAATKARTSSAKKTPRPTAPNRGAKRRR